MRHEPRLYIEQDLLVGQSVPLDEGSANYLLRVMRLGAGDTVRVFNGQHGEWRAELTEVTGKRGQLLPLEQIREQATHAGPDLTLLFAPVKKAETALIVEKATELGVRNIRPVTTEFTQTRSIRLDRLEKTIVEASEQTERLDLPVLSELVSLDAALIGLGDGVEVIFCDEAGTDDKAPWGGGVGRAKPMLNVLEALRGKPVAVLIGPEGGFSPAERDVLRGRAGTHPVSLGPRILRAETAAISALSLWQAVCGDWG
ncbi:MAG: 16S rRNA (uracil(1498)-N(3))-methyltransferase [Hyphomonas sp.]